MVGNDSNAAKLSQKLTIDEMRDNSRVFTKVMALFGDFFGFDSNRLFEGIHYICEHLVYISTQIVIN